MMRTILRSMSMVLDDQESARMTEFSARSKSKMKLNCLLILVYYVYDIDDGNNINGIHYGLSVGRPCVRCLITVADR